MKLVLDQTFLLFPCSSGIGCKRSVNLLLLRFIRADFPILASISHEKVFDCQAILFGKQQKAVNTFVTFFCFLKRMNVVSSPLKSELALQTGQQDHSSFKQTDGSYCIDLIRKTDLQPQIQSYVTPCQRLSMQKCTEEQKGTHPFPPILSGHTHRKSFCSRILLTFEICTMFCSKVSESWSMRDQFLRKWAEFDWRGMQTIFICHFCKLEHQAPH